VKDLRPRVPAIEHVVTPIPLRSACSAWHRRSLVTQDCLEK